MKWSDWPRWAVSALWLSSAGCTALREIPRGEYASRPQIRHVRMVTREGLTYEFDYIQVGGDSLVGYRRRDVQGPADEYASMSLPLEEVTKLSARSVDWTRTGLVGGGVIAALVARGLSNGGSGGKPSP
jgi:hypothetical protein